MTPLCIFNFDLSPTDKPLSPQFFKFALIISYSPKEKSIQSFLALFTFKSFILILEKSKSKASK